MPRLSAVASSAANLDKLTVNQRGMRIGGDNLLTQILRAKGYAEQTAWNAMNNLMKGVDAPYLKAQTIAP
jgi:hypothetical protein